MPGTYTKSLKERWSEAAARCTSLLDRYYASVPPYKLNITDKFMALALLAFFFSLYLYTCSHSPNIAGDSPELIAGTYSLGILHPPGYPLYTLIGYLFAHLPFRSIAFRVNLMSVVFHSLTLLLLYISAVKITRNRVASCIAAAVLGTSSVFWFYSQVAEVFPLNSLFAVLLIYVAVRCREEWLLENPKGSLRRLVLLALLAGLSLSHHHTIVLIFPALILFLPRQLFAAIRKPSWLLASSCAFLIGLLPYIYLPIRASQEPFLNFLNPSTFQNFKAVITREYYGSSRLWIGPEADHRIDLVFYFLNGLYSQVRLLGMALGVTGMYYAARKRFADFLPLLAAFFFSAVVFALLANVKVQNVFERSTIQRFFILPTIVFSYFIAIGLGATIDRLRTALASLTSVRYEIRNGLVWALTIAVIALLFMPAAKTAAAVNLRYDAVGEGFIKNLTASLETGSVLFVTGDVPVFLMEYREIFREDDKDFTVLVFPFLDQPWYFSHIRKYCTEISFPSVDEIRSDIRDNPTRDSRTLIAERVIRNNPQVPAFYILHTPKLDESLALQPDGIAFKIIPREEEVPLEEYFNQQLAYYAKFDLDGLSDTFYSSDRRELDLLQQVASYPYESGKYLADKGEKEKGLFFYDYAYQLYAAPEILKRMADIYSEMSDGRAAYHHLDLYVNSGTYSTTGIWEALMDMEDLLAEGKVDHAR